MARVGAHANGIQDGAFYAYQGGTAHTRLSSPGAQFTTVEPIATDIYFGDDLAYRWRMQRNGAFIAVTDNANDIGLSNNNRPRSIFAASRVVSGTVAATYGATVAINASTADWFTIDANNSSAFTIANPTNGVVAQKITLTIRNVTGGALGAVTFGANYKLAGAWTQPTSGNSRSITFVLNNFNGGWYELSRTAADVAN